MLLLFDPAEAQTGPTMVGKRVLGETGRLLVLTSKQKRGETVGSTSKKVFVPNGSLYRAYTLLPRIRSARHYSNLCFRLLISDADRRAIACAEAIRSVTHLVLAPDPKKLSCSFFSHSQSFFVFSLSFL